jgi:pimeloyl-ACP methyl ester carboxylesterase
MAYQLEGAPIWDTEIGAFLSAFKPPFPEGLLMMHPYRPGRVPVVLVHGTASSPARWRRSEKFVRTLPPPRALPAP